jgi:hypothetical protein
LWFKGSIVVTPPVALARFDDRLTVQNPSGIGEFFLSVAVTREQRFRIGLLVGLLQGDIVVQITAEEG